MTDTSSTAWAMSGQSQVHLCISLEFVLSTFGNCWQCWGLLGVIFWGGYVGSISWLSFFLASSSTYVSNIENTYLVEMLNSCSLGPCRARMQRPKTTMSSGIAFTHFIGILKSLSLDPCQAKTHQPATIPQTMFITHRKHIPH